MAAVACKHCDEVLVETPERRRRMPAGMIVLMAIYGLVVLILPFAVTKLGSSMLSPWEKTFEILVVLAMATLVVATLARRKWAWFGLIILQLFAVLLGVIDVMTDWTQIFGIILSIVILAYLGTPGVLSWFRIGAFATPVEPS